MGNTTWSTAIQLQYEHVCRTVGFIEIYFIAQGCAIQNSTWRTTAIFLIRYCCKIKLDQHIVLSIKQGRILIFLGWGSSAVRQWGHARIRPSRFPKWAGGKRHSIDIVLYCTRFLNENAPTQQPSTWASLPFDGIRAGLDQVNQAWLDGTVGGNHWFAVSKNWDVM